MRYRVLILTLAAFLVPACGDSHESAQEESMDVMDEMLEVVEGIKNSDDAKAAEEKLKELGEKWQAVVERVKELGEPSNEEAAELREKFGKRQDELQQRLAKLMPKLMQFPDLGKAWADAMGNPN